MDTDFQVKENSDLVTLNCEELDYEGDDIGFEKGSTVAVEQEEGEISDLEDDDNLENLTCFFFQQGKCDSGNKCPLLHMTDKGLYRMLDSPQSSVVAPITFLNVAPDTNFHISEPLQTALTDWDQALEEAKKRVQQFDTKTKRACPVTITIESDSDQSCLKLKKKTQFYKLPVSKVSRDSSHSSSFRGTLKQKQLAKENKQPREITERRKQRKSSISSTSRSGSQSPLRWKRFSLSERYSRGNHNSSSSSRSRSPHLSKERRPKAKSKLKCAIPEKKSRSLSKKDQQPIFSRRSSRSRSPSLLRHFREERSKNKPHSVTNRSSTDRSSAERRIAVLFGKPTIACRSLKSRSPVSVRHSREEKLKIPTKLQSIPERKSHSVDYKSNTNSKHFTRKRTESLFSKSDKQLKISHPFSPKSHSPPSVCRSEEEKLKIKQSAIPEKKSRSLKNNPERNLKDHDFIKKKISSPMFRQPRDVGHWTPKKTRPPSPVRNCSDMSISPLSDSSLSDLFDPDKKTNRMDKPNWYEATQSRLLPPQKIDKAIIYGPVCPQEIQSATLKSERIFETKDFMAQNKSLGPGKKTSRISRPYWYEAAQSRLLPPQKIGKPEVYGPVCAPEIQSATLQTKSSLERTIENCVKINLRQKDCLTQNKHIGPSATKQAQKRNVSALECDLLKFHKHRLRLEVSQPAAQQKVTERRIKSKDQMKAQKKCVQRKSLSRKEELLQQLAKINEVIDKKKKMCSKLGNSL